MNWLRKLFNFRERRDSGRPGSDDPDDHGGDVVKPFLEHLEDLRGTLFKMAVCIVVGGIIAFCVHDWLMALVKAPLAGTPVRLVAPDLVTPFMVSLKLSFYAGIVITFPFLLYFAAEFVLPALTRKERRLLLPGIFVGFLLFGCGVVISYYYILPKTVHWFQNYGEGMGVEFLLDISKYFGFVAHLTLACGFLCEVPIVIIALSLLNVVSYKLLAGTRPYAATMILILVAIISPSPDPVTFITLSAPVLGIYEICIWIVFFIERRRAK